MQTALAYRTNRDLFSNHYLDEHLPETEEWDQISEATLKEAYDDVSELWRQKRETAPKRNESQIEEKFIRPMFRMLGIPFEVEESTSRTQRRPDYGFFETADAARTAFQRREEDGDFYENAVAVADAKRWGRPLDTRGSGEHERDFENPSYQIHVYLQETPVQWAVLTDGRKWRLYYGPTSHRLDSYYEIDLPTLLKKDDLEDFKYFYLFFRHEAFVPEADGDCFLDDVHEESNVFAQELGEDLQDNIYEAIKILAEGFLQYPDNDLTEDDLDLIHDSALIYLYRLIFVLYAEAEGRKLLETDNEIYEESYSLNTLKQDVAEELDSGSPKYRDWQDTLWSRLDELFKLIDRGSKSRGIPEENLFVPAYNGGLFRTDPDEFDSPGATFLAENPVGDAYLARVIELLTRSQKGDGVGKIFVDYSSLDIRHLGSVYEGLLEYQLNVADEPLAVEDDEYVSADGDDQVTVEAGEVYLTTDSGERKATGSYYTPEYVVEYIVENTLEPLIEDIREDLAGRSAGGEGGFAEEFASKVFELKVLDPAMGSGHFLTSAVDYLAREIIDAQERQAAQEGIETVDEEHDINWARRQIAQRCIYGVDLNPLAVELAKVSLWLRTLAAEQPLAFLDHHLKTGNSLVGSDIEDVLDNGNGDETDDEQLTLQQSFDHTRRQALEHVTDRFQDLLAIDNETLDDVKEMEAVFEEVREDPLYRHLLAMANVHTADAFGLDVPADAYERMAQALRDNSWGGGIEEQDWFRSAQAMAEKERFFHWELEFPMAFYGEDGDREEDAGFDAVIGNPPYGAAFDEADQYYLRNKYQTTGSEYDSYTIFIEEGLSLVRVSGNFSYIVPTVWTKLENNEPLREILLSKTNIRSILDTGRVFSGAVVETLIFCAQGTSNKRQTRVGLIDKSGSISDRLKRLSADEITWTNVDQDEFYSNKRAVIDYDTADPEARSLIKKIDEVSNDFGCHADISQGITPYDSYAGQDPEIIENRAYHSDRKEDETYGKWLNGSDVGRYELSWNGEWLSYGEWLAAPREKRYFSEPRLLFREVTGGIDRVIATFSRGEYYYGHSVIPAVTRNSDYPGMTLLALVNSKISAWYNLMESPNAQKDTFPKMNPNDVSNLPVYRNVPEKTQALLKDKAENILDLKSDRRELNLDLLDYLGTHSGGPDLPDMGLFQPAGSSILDGTKEDYENLRIGHVRTERADTSVSIFATARYKPEDEDAHEIDQWGYTETELLEAFTLIDLTEEEAALVEAFVPVAADEAGGFANFRETATKTNSLTDRLKALTLPDPDEVADDLRRYIEARERAQELDEKIEKTDQRIDEIVYDLYDLTDEEIQTVESAVEDN